MRLASTAEAAGFSHLVWLRPTRRVAPAAAGRIDVRAINEASLDAAARLADVESQWQQLDT